jgi:hypothetical protein
MARARPRGAPVKFHASPPVAPSVALFPAAVAGEQYERYAKSVWTQAHHWVALHWARAAERATTGLDVRQKLRAIAATDIKRHLYPQEEQLLSAIVASWTVEAGPDELQRER